MGPAVIREPPGHRDVATSGHFLFGSVKGAVAGGRGWIVVGTKLCRSGHWEGKVLWAEVVGRAKF